MPKGDIAKFLKSTQFKDAYVCYKKGIDVNPPKGIEWELKKIKTQYERSYTVMCEIKRQYDQLNKILKRIDQLELRLKTIVPDMRLCKTHNVQIVDGQPCPICVYELRAIPIRK